MLRIDRWIEFVEGPIEKLVLRLAVDVGIPFVGFLFSFALAASAEGYLNARLIHDYRYPLVTFLAFTIGLFVTSLASLAIQRKLRPWNPDKKALRTWTERKLHPPQARYKRLAVGILVCLPSLLAAFVLFFFPVATHFYHPSSRYLRHYRIPIPWTFAIPIVAAPLSEDGFVGAFAVTNGRGRLGMTTFPSPLYWRPPERFAFMTFYALRDAEIADRQRGLVRAETANPIVRQFDLSGVPVTCLLYQVRPDHRGLWAEYAFDWTIHCTTPPIVRHNFSAHFEGREQDIPAFFRIVEGVRPIE